MSRRTVIEVSGFRKTYKSFVAVDDVSFEVYDGEIFGLIGPNGAGKTTTMECVEGLRTPDSGRISVLGLDPFRDIRSLQNRIGVQLQEAQLQKRIKVKEAVHLARRLYKVPASEGDRLLEQLGLADKRNAWLMTLSGGQKQRLFIVLALINDPEVVFLDELTTGLDPQSRRTIWELVRGIRERGKTVFLTTHLMEEAERLCDRVAIIERGKIIDVDTPERLVRKYCPERRSRARDERRNAQERFSAIPGVENVSVENGKITIRGNSLELVTEVIRCISESRIEVSDFRTILPTLEDVFLKVTGHSIPGLADATRTSSPHVDRDQDLLPRATRRHRTVAVPVIMFIILGKLGNRVGPPRSAAAMNMFKVDVPVFAGILIALNAVLSLVSIIAIYREGGILKRLRATPLRPATILTAHVLVKLILTAVTLTLTIVAGKRYYPIGAEVPLVSFGIALLIATWSILSVGFLIASIVPTARFAQPIGAAILYPMLGLSGLFVPVTVMPGWMISLSKLFR